MIIVKIIGGLGNQLFQYATARAIAYKNNDVFFLDIEGFKNYNLRKFRLNLLQLYIEFADKKNIYKLRGYDGLWRKILNKLNIDIIRPKTYYKEKIFCSFEESVFYFKNIYLDGYWQNEKYFYDIKNILQKEIVPKKLSLDAQRYLHQIQKNNSISIHVRRGDYLKLKHIYKILDTEYYKKAIKIIESKISNPHYFIFSDDIEWCKNNLGIEGTYVYNTKDIEDLYLMKNCKHNIICNSTFSWWAAWLNENKVKIIITPKIWFSKEEWKDFRISLKREIII